MPVQTVISTDDSLYLHWQTQLLLSSMEKVGQPGPLTQLIATKEKKTRPLIGNVSSFFTTPYSPHPITEDFYPPYNKPASLREWAHATPDKGETLLIIDPDCVFFDSNRSRGSTRSPHCRKHVFHGTLRNPCSKRNQEDTVERTTT